MWHVWEREALYIGPWRVNTTVRDHLEYPGVDERIIHVLTCIFK